LPTTNPTSRLIPNFITTLLILHITVCKIQYTLSLPTIYLTKTKSRVHTFTRFRHPRIGSTHRRTNSMSNERVSSTTRLLPASNYGFGISMTELMLIDKLDTSLDLPPTVCATVYVEAALPCVPSERRGAGL
jgi:phosphatidylinositol kinase/protein kinase (PI-3  family)